MVQLGRLRIWVGRLQGEGDRHRFDSRLRRSSEASRAEKAIMIRTKRPSEGCIHPIFPFP